MQTLSGNSFHGGGKILKKPELQNIPLKPNNSAQKQAKFFYLHIFIQVIKSMENIQSIKQV